MNPLSYGGIVTVIGLVIVFFGMTILIGLLVLMAQIFKSLDRKKKAEADAVKPVEVPAPVPEETEPETEPVEDQNELIAVIAAAIAAFDGGNKSLVIKSVRRVSGWKNAARAEQVYKY